MSNSRVSKKASSLAKFYDHFENKKRSKKYGVSKTGIDGVVDKIEEAVQNDDRFLAAAQNTTKQTSPVPTSGAEYVDNQSAPGDPESQEDGVAGACATNISEVKKKGMAASLIDSNQLWDNFFSELMDDAADAVEDDVREMEVEYTHSIEVSQAVKRGERRLSHVCNLPLKLILTPLGRGRKMANAFASLLEMRFGPLHVALQVGNVVLEWNDTSLVTPHLCAYEDQVMELDVQQHSKWVEYTAHHHPEMQKAAQDLDYSQQIELTYKVTSQKMVLIDALIDLIILYNKRYYYNLFDRNCQHFVLDALRALEVSIPKDLPGGLGKYYKALLKGKTPSVPAKFKTHCDLDEYVMRKTREKTIDDMPQHDLEFLLALYFRFHLESRAKLKDDRVKLEAWQCGELQCYMGEVERRIQMESMKIHSFKPTW